MKTGLAISIDNLSEFSEAIASPHSSWSYEGLQALYNYLDDLADDLGEVIAINPVEIRCSFTEIDAGEFTGNDEAIIAKLPGDRLLIRTD